MSSAHDTLQFLTRAGRVRLPGIASVKPDGAVDVDAVPASGVDGVVIGEVRYQPLSVSVELKMWTAAQFADMRAVVSQLGPRADRSPEILTPIHPWFDLFDVRQVYIKSVSFEPVNPRSGYLASLQLQELHPEPVKARSSKSNASAVSGVNRVSVDDVLGAYAPSAGDVPAP